MAKLTKEHVESLARGLRGQLPRLPRDLTIRTRKLDPGKVLRKIQGPHGKLVARGLSFTHKLDGKWVWAAHIFHDTKLKKGELQFASATLSGVHVFPTQALAEVDARKICKMLGLKIRRA